MTDTAAKDTLSITVDGREMEASAGELLIDVAERNGCYIPRFCYHPRMKPVGMCRMCLVEVKGPRGFTLQPACFIPVTEGQEVVTDSPLVKKAQDGVLEFLLVNHPLDCPVCDKGGECPLQDHTITFGPGETRFNEEKRHWEKPIALSDLVLLDRERCIQCARCTRFADEIAGDSLIEFVNRGDRTEVNTFPDSEFASYFSGNTVQICPVGALTSAPYRFRARPWDLDQVESTCTSCAVGCRITIQSSGDRVTRYQGVDSGPVNHGWLCDKGRYDHEHIASDARLARPKVRRGDALAEATWGEALAAAAQGLDDARKLHGAEAIAVIGGARLANEDAYAWAKLAKGVLGTDNVDAQIGDGLPAELVLGLPRATIADAVSAKVVILLGPDLKEELPVLYLRLRAAALEGTTVIEVSPKASGLTRYASHSLQHRPGEALAVTQALVQGGASDAAGVPGAALDAAAKALRDAAGDVVVVLGRSSLAEAPDGIVAAASALASVAGVRFLPALRRANVHGALDMGLAPGVLPGRVTLDAGRAWFGGEWPTVPEASGLDTTGILTAAAEGRVRGLVLLGADPLADFPDRALAERAMAGAGFVLALDTFETASVRRADVVLPVAAYGERSGTTTNIEGRVTVLNQKVSGPGTVRPDWMVAVELANLLGADLEFESLDDIWAEIERLAPAHHGVTRAMVCSGEHRDGVVVPLAQVDEPAPSEPPSDAAEAVVADAPGEEQPSDPAAAEAQAEVIEAPTGDVEARDADAVADAEAATGDFGAEPGPTDQDLHEAPVGTGGTARPAMLEWSAPGASTASAPLDAYSLRLVSGRVLYDGGTIVQATPALAGLTPTARLSVNPFDLDRLGVASGGRVRVTGPHASLVVDVRADSGVPRGCASLPFNLPGAAAADLIDVTRPVTDVRVETV